jgi:hypothetical protein
MSSYSEWTVGPGYYSALAMAETLGNGSQVLDISTAYNLSDASAAYVIYENNQPVRIGVINYVTDPSGASDIQFTFSVGGSNLGQSNATPSQVQVKYVPLSFSGDTCKLNILRQIFTCKFHHTKVQLYLGRTGKIESR